jgi:dissimilatory sulfite reductase (desulfoviridin) alpha/beta subunit
MRRVAELPNVTVRITCFSAGQYEARRLSDFVIMAHPWGNPRVHIEGYSGGQFLTDADEVACFASAFDHATRIAALPPAASIDFIRQQASNWRTTDA